MAGAVALRDSNKKLDYRRAQGKCYTVPKRVMGYMVRLIDESSFIKNSALFRLPPFGVSEKLSITG